MAIQHIIKNAVEYIKNNPEKIGQVAMVVGSVGKLMFDGGKKVIDEMQDTKKVKLEKGGYPYRKERKIIFQSELFKKLPEMKKKELFFYILEVEDILELIQTDISNSKIVNPKNMLLKKELKSWTYIYHILLSTMNNLDYEELLLHYHDPSYQSNYFEGFKLILETLDTHVSNGEKDKIYYYIKEITDKPMAKIKKDFI